MITVQVVMLMLLATFFAGNVSATTTPLPYLLKEDVGKMEDVQEVFRAILSLQGENTFRRTEFFTEMSKNLGLTESEILEVKDTPSRVQIVSWQKGMPPLITAGLRDKSVYWRFVRPGEKLVMFKIRDAWKPAFLLRCANPVRVIVNSKQASNGTTLVSDRRVGCWSTGKTQVQTHRPHYIENGGLFGDKEVVYTEKEYTYVFPVQCITDEDYKKAKLITE